MDPLGRDILSNIPRPERAAVPTNPGNPPPKPNIPDGYPSFLKPIPINTRSVEGVLRRYLDENEPQAQRILYSTWTAQEDALKFQEIRNAIRDGEMSPNVLNQFHQEYSRFVNERLAPMMDAAIQNGRQYMANEVARSIGRDFELTNVGQRAAAWMEQRTGELITAISDQQRNAVNRLVRYFAINEPIGPRELGRYLRPVIRLTERDTNAVIRFREQLLKANPGISKKRLIHQVENYSAFLWRRRAESVARTELAFAHNYGQFETVRGAVQEGVITRPVVKQWWTARDERTCPWCFSLHGETVGMDETYPGMTQMVPNTYVAPAHPRCRCSIIYSMLSPEGSEGIQQPASQVPSQPTIPPQPPATPGQPPMPSGTPENPIRPSLPPSETSLPPVEPSAPQAVLPRSPRALSPTSFDMDDFLEDERYAYVDDGAIEIWNENIRENPKVFLNNWLKDLPGRKSVLMKNEVADEIRFDIESVDDNNHLLFRATRKFNFFDIKKVDHSYFRVNEDHQGISNWGKTFFRNAYKIYERIGIEKITIHANIDIGGYAWAKYGFVPYRESWIELKDFIRLRIFDLELDLDTLELIDNLLESDDPYTIWDIADISVPYDFILSNGRQAKVGQMLLLDSDWEGLLDLTNPTVTDRSIRYARI